MMRSPGRRWFLAGLVSFVCVPGLSQAAEPQVFAGSIPGVAINGYDAVAYFTEEKPIKGSEAFTHSWNGAIWRFASAQNRDAFAGEPGKFAPQYGGYCAYAVASGYTAKTEPEAFSIVGGKLYLNYSTQVRQLWSKDISGYVAKADAHWPKVLK